MVDKAMVDKGLCKVDLGEESLVLITDSNYLFTWFVKVQKDLI